MSEIFTAVIVATIMTMRPCLQAFARSVAAVATDLSPLRLHLSRLTNNELNISVLNGGTQNQSTNCKRVDERGFHIFEEPVRIKLQSTECSTEKLIIPTNKLV